jgi:hypothetical protein
VEVSPAGAALSRSTSEVADTDGEVDETTTTDDDDDDDDDDDVLSDVHHDELELVGEVEPSTVSLLPSHGGLLGKHSCGTSPLQMSIS